MARHCSRSGCSHEAVATLSFQYARSTAWLDDLTPLREPHCYDLCENHARRTTPPSGWRLEDRRHRFQAVARDEAAVRRDADDGRGRDARDSRDTGFFGHDGGPTSTERLAG